MTYADYEQAQLQYVGEKVTGFCHPVTGKRIKAFRVKADELNDVYLLVPKTLKESSCEHRSHEIYRIEFVDTFHGSLANTIDMLRVDEAARRFKGGAA